MQDYKDVSMFTSRTLYRGRLSPILGMVLAGCDHPNPLRYLQRKRTGDDPGFSLDWYIDRKGVVYEITPVGHASKHIGSSDWNGRAGTAGTLNMTHMGLGLQQEDVPGAGITQDQYRALADLWVLCWLNYGWAPYDTCTAFEAALPPMPRLDPHGWDWPTFEMWVNHYAGLRAPRFGKVVFRG